MISATESTRSSRPPDLESAYSAIHVIVCGTDPASALGGIGVVMSGYLAALDSQGISNEMLPTYRPGRLSGKWLPWLIAIPTLMLKIRRYAKAGLQVVVYTHAGALPSMFREFVVTGLARLVGARTIIHSHSPEMAMYLKRYVPRFLVKAFFSTADVVCALTPWWRDQLAEAHVNPNVVVVPNPLPPSLLERVQQTAQLQKERETITVLTMARLVPGKGVDISVRAIPLAPDNVTLVVAGTGSAKASLEKLATDLGIQDRVKFVGWVSGSEKADLLDRADLFCLPSTNDVFPMSVVEAFCYGLPVIAARWGGIPDLVTDGETGILTTPGDHAEVGAAMRKLADRNLRATMGHTAQKQVLELCSAEKVGSSLAAIMKSIGQCRQ